MTKEYKSVLEELTEEDLEDKTLIKSIIEDLEASIEIKDEDLKRAGNLLDSREAEFRRIRRLNTCIHCEENIEQYKKIRSAFDRKKQQHQAIAKFFKHYHFTHNGQKMSLTKLIKFGQELQ